MLATDRMATRGVFDDAISLGNDMQKIVKMNMCESPGLKCFERNLYRFATRLNALLLPEKVTLAFVLCAKTTGKSRWQPLASAGRV